MPKLKVAKTRLHRSCTITLVGVPGAEEVAGFMWSSFNQAGAGDGCVIAVAARFPVASWHDDGSPVRAGRSNPTRSRRSVLAAATCAGSWMVWCQLAPLENDSSSRSPDRDDEAR